MSRSVHHLFNTQDVINTREAYDLIDLADKLIERLAKHQEPLDSSSADVGDASDEQRRLRSEFLLLRIAHVRFRSLLETHADDAGMETGPSRSG